MAPLRVAIRPLGGARPRVTWLLRQGFQPCYGNGGYLNEFLTQVAAVPNGPIRPHYRATRPGCGSPPLPHSLAQHREFGEVEDAGVAACPPEVPRHSLSLLPRALPGYARQNAAVPHCANW